MEILNGKRENTFLYIYEGYSYHKNSKNPNIYRCSSRQKQQCTGTLLYENGQFVLQKQHTHCSNPQYAEVLKLKSAILEECRRTPSINNKIIFDNICRTNPDAAAHISYNSLKSIMSREKLKSRPPLPKTIQSTHEILVNYDGLKDIYKGCAISSDNKYALIFSNTTLLTALENAKEIYMDGTFSVVPRMPPFHQLYTVHIRYNDTGIATIFALCECRTAAMYRAIWRKIVSLVPQLQHNLETVMCDYERAAMQTIEEQFPRVTIHGCWFHFNQALLRKWRKLGLHRAPREILSMAMTMALIPSDMFLQALHEMQLIADRLCGTYPNVLLFMAYLRSVWLPISARVSVYGCAVRTNNLVEAFHNTLSQRFQTTRPNLWIFLDDLSKLMIDETTDYERLKNNLKVTRVRTRSNRARNEKIKLSQDNLISGILPLYQFLNMFNKDYQQQQYISNLLSSDCDENDAHDETPTDETFSIENRLLEITHNDDHWTHYAHVQGTFIDGISNDGNVPSISMDNAYMCIETEGVPTYNSSGGNDLFIICNCKEGESCAHLENGNKRRTIEGDVSSTDSDKQSDMCTKALQELHISVDNMTENVGVCTSTDSNEHNLMEEEASGRRICCCKPNVSRMVLPCGHVYICANSK